MGITPNSLELISNHLAASRFESAMIVGWQKFWHFNTCDHERVSAILTSIPSHGSLNLQNGGDAVSLFKVLGATNIDVIDASDYEGANIICDFNYPLTKELESSRYNLLFDGGSLEHIYNVPVALRNCMRLISPGGMYMGIFPCDGWAGHGFYQFSPEFFYRSFCEENGFTSTRVIIYHEVGDPNYQEFPDPKRIGRRLEFRLDRPTSIFVTSLKISDAEIFSSYPNQSDYEFSEWKK